MAVVQSQIAADYAHIHTDLAATDATETVTVYEPDGVTERGTSSAVRGIRLTATELRDSGFADQYAESVYLLTDVGAVREDVVSMTTGDYRVLRTAPGPMGVYFRLDLGDKWQ